MTDPTIYKTFRPGRIGPFSNKKWPKRIGAWATVEGPLELCIHGIHVARGTGELLEHLDSEVFEVEARGERLDGDFNACWESVRLVRRVITLNDRTLRLFSADCAERALVLVDDPDARSVESVRVARRFARGGASWGEFQAAAGAAWDAIGAWDSWAEKAAWAAGSPWDSWASRDSRVSRAAKAASWAAGDAEAEEREWQVNRLQQYIDGDGLEAQEASDE